MATKNGTVSLLTLEEFLAPHQREYTWRVPSRERDVRLRCLTHGEVNQFTQDYIDAGFRITDALKDRLTALGLVAPAVTTDQLRETTSGTKMIEEIYTQIAVECGFIADPSANKPTVHIPVELHEDDARLLSRYFTVSREPRPVEADADPLVPASQESATIGSAS